MSYFCKDGYLWWDPRVFATSSTHERLEPRRIKWLEEDPPFHGPYCRKHIGAWPLRTCRWCNALYCPTCGHECQEKHDHD